jgi:hypothetical protein
MAIGAGQLAEKECIVKHFTAIEELAGMDVLCSDKTGTLTKNKLEVFDSLVYDKKYTKEDILFFGALAANELTKDAIDTAMFNYISAEQTAELAVCGFNSGFSPVFSGFSPVFSVSPGFLRFSGFSPVFSVFLPVSPRSSFFLVVRPSLFPFLLPLVFFFPLLTPILEIQKASLPSFRS